MGGFVGFEVDEDKALEQAIVENEINLVFVVFDEESLLTSNEGEAITEFQKEFLQMGNQCVFQIALILVGLLLQAKEFQVHGVFDNLRGRFGCPLATGHGEDGFFVVALEKTFI